MIAKLLALALAVVARQSDYEATQKMVLENEEAYQKRPSHMQTDVLYPTYRNSITHKVPEFRDVPLADKVYILADIHGDYVAMIEMLAQMDIIDRQTLDWKDEPEGKSRLLIQLGDMNDRGPQSIAATSYLMRLQESAGPTDQIEQLVGNHELMMVCGQYTYFNDQELNYVFEGSNSNLAKFYTPGTIFGDLIRQKYRLTLKLSDMFFTHAGLESGWAALSESAVWKAFWDNADNMGCAGRIDGFEPSNVVWTRKISSNISNKAICSTVDEVTALAGVTAVVVGHTPTTSGRVEKYCGGKWIMHDTGLSRWMKSNPVYSVYERTNDSKGDELPLSQWKHTEYALKQHSDGTLYMEGRPLKEAYDADLRDEL